LRAVTLPSKRQVLLSDTVGFIRNLPHTLVSAFRATLEEVQRAELLLHVSDATSPTAAEQAQQVETVLDELEAGGKPRIDVMNKVDLLAPTQRESLVDDDRTIHVSAVKGMNLGRLLEAIDHKLQNDPLSRVHLRIPQSEGKVLAMLEGKARIYAREYRDGAVELEAQAPESLVRKLKAFIVE
jgi:GTPase